MHNQGKQLGDGSLAVSCFVHDVDYDFKIGMKEELVSTFMPIFFR